MAQETFFRSILNKEDKCWPEFYKYIKMRKGYRENIPAIKDCNGRSITDSKEKAILLTITILRYSTGMVTFNIYSAPTQAYSSPLIRKSSGKR
jgi:hypothetical protein